MNIQVIGSGTNTIFPRYFSDIVIKSTNNNFKFSTDDTDASYSVNGMFVSFIAGGRR